MDSLDGLDRLLEAEKKASGLIHEAETEAGLLIGQAQDEAKKAERKALAEVRASLTQEETETGTRSQAALAAELDDYRKGLETQARDQVAFGRLCASILFPEA